MVTILMRTVAIVSEPAFDHHLARASPERVLPLSSCGAESSCLPQAYSKVLSRRKSPAASLM